MFVNFERPFDAAELADFQATLFRLLDQYDGFLGRVGQIGGKDNGNTLLLFWGAPTGSEHDVERALGFILDLQDASPGALEGRRDHAHGLRRVRRFAAGRGIHLLRILCQFSSAAVDRGRLGRDLDRRRERAPGSTPLSDSRRHGAHRFKGFADPQPVFVLTGRQATDAQAFYAGDAGRAAGRNWTRLRAGVEPIFAGDFAGIVTIEGEAGLGKSRLVHEFERATGVDWRSRHAGFSARPTTFCAGRSIRSATGYATTSASPQTPRNRPTVPPSMQRWTICVAPCRTPSWPAFWPRN